MFILRHRWAKKKNYPTNSEKSVSWHVCYTVSLQGALFRICTCLTHHHQQLHLRLHQHPRRRPPCPATFEMFFRNTLGTHYIRNTVGTRPRCPATVEMGRVAVAVAGNSVS